MMNKALLFTLIFACIVLPMTAGSAPDKNDGTTLPPMFLLGTNNGMMQMVYWTNPDEPQLDEEYPEYFEEQHQAWEVQEQFRRNASKYTKLIVDGNKTRDVNMWMRFCSTPTASRYSRANCTAGLKFPRQEPDSHSWANPN